MENHVNSVEGRLIKLKVATDSIRPNSGFENRVMRAIAARGVPDFRAHIWRVGRYGLFASFVVLALSAFFAANRASRADELNAMTYGTVEQEW